MKKYFRLVWHTLVTLLGVGVALALTHYLALFFHHQFRVFTLVLITYFVAAYIVLPLGLRLGVKLFGRHRVVPRYTLSSAGVPADPINIALIGTREQLEATFADAGWSVADKLGLRSSLHMVVSFVLSRPYPTAPFSSLYVHGRRQDIGFQLPIGDSPRRRHHIRFWDMPLDSSYDVTNSLHQWADAQTHLEKIEDARLWIGAGTKDTGFGFTKFTWQISHSVDDDANAEREFIIGAIEATGKLTAKRMFAPPPGHTPQINQYICDGDVAAAILKTA